jgi:hypothetical protein
MIKRIGLRISSQSNYKIFLKIDKQLLKLKDQNKLKWLVMHFLKPLLKFVRSII